MKHSNAQEFDDHPEQTLLREMCPRRRVLVTRTTTVSRSQKLVNAIETYSYGARQGREIHFVTMCKYHAVPNAVEFDTVSPSDLVVVL